MSHLHRLGFVHRDIKLQNIFLYDENSWDSVKIADFGLSSQKCNIQKFNPRCGTPGYTAPEVFDQNSIYDEKVDIYSAGIILYNLLTMKNPFGNSKNPQDTIQRNMVGDYDKTHLIKVVNEQPKAYDLLVRMLEKNPKLRPTADECLRFELFKAEKKTFDESVFSALQ